MSHGASRSERRKRHKGGYEVFAKSYTTTQKGQPGLLRKTWPIALGVAALVAASQIELPFYPVPMTLQTLAVIGVGLTLGLRGALAAVSAFLVAGFCGLPLFAGGAGGPAVLIGPTGGYLIGFLLSAGFCGWARDRGWTRQLRGSLGVALLGAVLVYPTDLLQLGLLLGFDKPILAWGLYPFIVGDLVKAALAGLVLAALPPRRQQ